MSTSYAAEIKANANFPNILRDSYVGKVSNLFQIFICGLKLNS
jgi:hypothetical protein